MKETVKFVMFSTRYLQLCPQQIVEAVQKTETQLKHSSVCLICTYQMAERNVRKRLTNN